MVATLLTSAGAQFKTDETSTLRLVDAPLPFVPIEQLNANTVHVPKLSNYITLGNTASETIPVGFAGSMITTGYVEKTYDSGGGATTPQNLALISANTLVPALALATGTAAAYLRGTSFAVTFHNANAVQSLAINNSADASTYTSSPAIVVPPLGCVSVRFFVESVSGGPGFYLINYGLASQSASPVAPVAYGMFFGTSGAAGAPDYGATVADGADFPIPNVGFAVGGVTALTASTFKLATAGQYEIQFQSTCTEAGQVAVFVQPGGVGAFSAYAASRVGRATVVANQFFISCMLSVSANTVISIRNNGSGAPLTVTPNGGGANPATTTLLIRQLN